MKQSETETLRRSAARLDAWIEAEEFKGWDPYDALNSPLLKRLAFGDRRLGQAWVQLLKRSPANLRPLLGIPKAYNPKAMGLFLASYWRKYLLSGDPAHLERVRFFSDWLQANSSPGYHGACWGYNFDWPNRGFFAPAGTPTIVNTAFIALAFLDLQQLSENGQDLWGQVPVELARGACEFICRDLNRLELAGDEVCFSYTPLDRRFIHNANLLGAWLLARVACSTGENSWSELALGAARYTVRRQLPDGAWKYGEGTLDNWVDNFHTGFVLVALRSISQLLDTDEFTGTLTRGYHFWKDAFFTDGGVPKYYPDRQWPIDVHNLAQGIMTYQAFADHDPQACESAVRLALWGASHFQDEHGYFYYQIHPGQRIRIPYMRWSQAWMQRAFTELQYGGGF